MEVEEAEAAEEALVEVKFFLKYCYGELHV